LKTLIIFDASVLVSGQVSSNLYKTGLYRVSWELLTQLEKDQSLDIYLYDIFQRERELKVHILPLFKNSKQIHVFGFLYRLLIFPLGNMADTLRSFQVNTKNRYIKAFVSGVKVILLLFEKAARKIEKLWFVEKRLEKSFNKFHVYYSTYFPIPTLAIKNDKIRKIYTLHDLIPILHPEYFSSPYNERLVREVMDSIGKDDFAFAVSQSTKNDMLNYRPDLNPEHIHVAHLAASELFYKVTDKNKLVQIKQKYGISETPYILSLCTMEPRKNLSSLVAAFKKIINETPEINLQLVLIGSYGWNSSDVLDEIQKIINQKPKAIVITGFVPDEDLAALYSGALVFVYPSFYEGFGLPVLEAMQCGVPIICSNTSSLPEIVGDCAILINPESVPEIINAIQLVLTDSKIRKKMQLSSVKQASIFHWEKSALTLCNILKIKGGANSN